MKMSDDVQIRLLHVEFLRPGPPHNQLLSPLTQYLAISGDSGAGVVTVPYEQAEFSARLKQLRYDSGESEDRLAIAAFHRRRDEQDSRRRTRPRRCAHDGCQSARNSDSTSDHALRIRARDAAVRDCEGAGVDEHRGELADDPPAAAGLPHAQHSHRLTRRGRLAGSAAHSVHLGRFERRTVQTTSRGAAQSDRAVSAASSPDSATNARPAAAKARAG